MISWFENYTSRWLVMFLYQGEQMHMHQRKPRFNLMYDKFRFDGDFFERNLDASVERSTKRQKLLLTRPASCWLSSSLSTMRQCLGPLVSHSSFSSFEGVCPNQEPLSLSSRFFFFPLWAGFFRFLYPRTFFSAFDFSIRISVKCFH